MFPLTCWTTRIVFTSDRDDEYGGDSNNDGTASAPSNRNWGYIQINDSATDFHDVLVRYGGYRDDNPSSSYVDWRNYQVWVNNASPTIRDSTFEFG